MAIEKRQTLGEVTGTLGDIVRRKRYGKIVVSRRPSRYRKSKSKKAVDGRNSFALSVAFAKAVNKIPHLKQVWQLAKLEGVVAYNRVIKYNKLFIKDNTLTLKNIITPKGIYLLLTEFNVQDNHLTLKIDLKENDLKQLLNIPFYLHIIFYLSDPVNSIDNPFVVSSQSYKVEKEPEDIFYDLDIAMDNINQQYLSLYKNGIVYIAATNFKGSKKEIFWTGTVARQIYD